MHRKFSSYSKQFSERVTTRLSKQDLEELEYLAMLWGLDISDIIRISVKKFLTDPTVDFKLDVKTPKEELRAKR